MTIAEIIALLEAGETGREIEFETRIYCALHPDQRVLMDPGDVRTKRPAEYGRLADFPLGGWADWDALARAFGVPAYLRSLDAALTLVLEGLEWELSTLYGIARAAVGLNCQEGPFHGEALDESAPRALCIAALKAREAQR